MKKDNVNNPEAFILEYNSKDFYITASKTFFTHPTTLHICRETGKIRQYPAGSSPLKGSDKSVKQQTFSLLIGIIIVRGQPFLAFVKEAQKVCDIVQHSIYQIRKVTFASFRAQFDETTLGYAETAKLLDSINQLILQNNFYFSYDYPLTLSQQRQQQGSHTISPEFFWNEKLLQRFFGLNLEVYWHLPIIQGFISYFNEENDYIHYHYIMISRRSKEMAGTRFNSRGIDSYGHAANFVQTEEILICHNFVLAYVQLRGSMPIFWSQSGFGSTPQFPQNRNNAMYTPKHYRMLEDAYGGKIVTVNLLSLEKDSSEKEISKRFESVMAALPERSRDDYITFDFNRQIQGKEDVQTIISNFVARHEKILLPTPNILVKDYYRNKMIADQNSYNRINCLDCLDRTNVIMFKLSEKTLRYFEATINSLVNNQEEKMIKLSKHFFESHREAWLNNGDRISLIYSGTESLSSYITKGEKNKNFFSLIGSSFKSINRFYNANVNDDYKQECINYILGVGDECRTFYFDDNIQKRIEPTKFNNFSQVGMCILSWNCNQLNPSTVDLTRLFDFQPQTNIIVICLQEIVELNTYNVLLGANKSTQQLWREKLEFHLREKMGRNYTYLVQNDLVGILTMVFIVESDRQRISSLNWSDIKTGFKGNLGNKGAVLLSFSYDDTIITIINCHLEAGEGKITERLYNLEYIHQHAFPERFKRRQFQNSQFTFLVGDLNFRIDMPFEQGKEIFYQVEKKQVSQPNYSYIDIVKKLLTRDQINMIKTKHAMLSSYQESTSNLKAEEITFLPTYKYVKGTNQYDFKSKRMPSWCDRILYSAGPLKLLPRSYGRRQINDSDHKPVVGQFDLMIRREDKNKKRAEFEKFMSE